jgi:hypothetical protein
MKQKIVLKQYFAILPQSPTTLLIDRSSKIKKLILISATGS